MTKPVESSKLQHRARFGCLKVCVIIAGILIAILLPIGWYLGVVPLANGPARSGIRHALNLRVLPLSLRVNASGSESWTDYIFEADFNIAPHDFEKLMAGRQFKKETLHPSDQITRASRIDGYQGFAVSEKWHWTLKGMEVDYFIYISESRDRVFINYSAE